MEKNVKGKSFATRQIHAGQQTDPFGSVTVPIYQTSTFEFDTVQQGGRRFAGEEDGYIYSRITNPSVDAVEAQIASLECGEAALGTASGMGAIAATIWTIVKTGDEILSSDTLYGCTFTLFTQCLKKMGVETKLVDFTDLKAFKAALTEKTTVVYLESPCNPNMTVIDIDAISKAAHEYNPEIKVVVDNTFNSPYIQTPLTHGADIVVHSATKYINGHADVIAGFIISTQEFIDLCNNTGFKDMTGAVMAPMSAFLISRGLKTLDIRMERHCANAQKIAEFLSKHKAVKKVYYPGLKNFDGYKIAQKQMRHPGGMLSFELKADRDTTANALNKLKLCTIAVSLGGPETLLEHPASMTHSFYTPEELEAAHIPQGLVRMSVGLEDPDEIIADLKSVLDTLV